MRRLLIFLAAAPFAHAQAFSIAQMAQDASQAAAVSAAAQDGKSGAQPADQAKASDQAKPADPKPAEAAKADDQAKPAQSPVPAPEITFSGWIDLGARIRSDVGGSLAAYRSLVNLHTGFALLGTELTIADPNRRLFDEIHVRASDWGDEPYESLHIDARKNKLYDFGADYRDIAYYDYLPSYADPMLATSGIMLDQQSFDTRRKFGHFELTMLPGNWISPYAAYDFDRGDGAGVSTYVGNGDEYPIPTTLRDRTMNYRGGIRFELRRFHVTLEGGGTRYNNDQTVYQANGVNYGDSLSPVFGQRLDLTDLLGAYGAHGNSTYTKALLTANPFSWIDIYGQFLYSEPKSVVNYQEYAGGNLYLQSQLLFYNAEQYLVGSTARQPHTTGSFGTEIRPFRRVRFTENWVTDRMHNTSGASQTQNILAPSSETEQLLTLLNGALANNYNQIESMLYFEVTPRLTLRGGYRYVWGDANEVTLPAEGLAYSDHVRMRRNVGIGGFTYRPVKKISLSAEGESASSGGEYFRSSLWDYQKVRAQARYQLLNNLSLSADFSLLNNQNPQNGIKLDYLAHQESLSLFWSPNGSKVFDAQATYSRSDLRSDIDYLDPATGLPLVSAYRDDSHAATGLFRLHMPAHGWFAPQLVAGGSFVITSGTRATSFYEPMAKLSIPTGKHLSWFAEWRYYGYGEAFYLYEGFRAHLATVGLRYSR